MECKCIELSKMERIPSQGMYRYSRNHLLLVSVDKDAWEAVYICPETGIKFHQKYDDPVYPQRIEIPKWYVVED